MLVFYRFKAHIHGKMLNDTKKSRIVIVGGGFAGLAVAKRLRRADAEVILIDRRNHHLFQPLLYQVATGAISPANIAVPLRSALAKQKNTCVLLGEVTHISRDPKTVTVSTPEAHTLTVEYDYLILATGSTHSYFGNDQWESLAPGLKTLDDALTIRQRFLSTFEAAQSAIFTGASQTEINRALTFVVVGAGPTGVELAGAIGEITRDTLRHNFRKLDPKQAKIYLIEAAPRILNGYDETLAAKAQKSLEELGVTVCCGHMVSAVSPHNVTLKTAEGEKTIDTECVIWAAGVQASPLGKLLEEQFQTPRDRMGRVSVNADLSLPGADHIFVLGDLARFTHTKNQEPLPSVAAVAMQQGEFLGRYFYRKLRQQKLPAFVYTDLGKMATIGRGRAIVDIHGFHLTGTLAWLAWLFVHLIKLAGFGNRILVLFQWAWSFITLDRTARLIYNRPSYRETL
jgi:NADH dehydrogenase